MKNVKITLEEADRANETYISAHLPPQNIEKHISEIATLDLDTVISKQIRVYGTVRTVSIEFNYFFIEPIEYDNAFFRCEFYCDDSKTEGYIVPMNDAKVSFLLARSGTQIYAYSVNIIPKWRNN